MLPWQGREGRRRGDGGCKGQRKDLESWRRMHTGILELWLHQLLFCSHVKITAKKSTSSGTFHSSGTWIDMLYVQQAGENRRETAFTCSWLFHLGCSNNNIISNLIIS